MTLEFNIRYKVTAKTGKREVRGCGACGFSGGTALRLADFNGT